VIWRLRDSLLRKQACADRFDEAAQGWRRAASLTCLRPCGSAQTRCVVARIVGG